MNFKIKEISIISNNSTLPLIQMNALLSLILLFFGVMKMKDCMPLNLNWILFVMS